MATNVNEEKKPVVKKLIAPDQKNQIIQLLKDVKRINKPNTAPPEPSDNSIAASPGSAINKLKLSFV